MVNSKFYQRTLLVVFLAVMAVCLVFSYVAKNLALQKSNGAVGALESAQTIEDDEGEIIYGNFYASLNADKEKKIERNTSKQKAVVQTSEVKSESVSSEAKLSEAGKFAVSAWIDTSKDAEAKVAILGEAGVSAVTAVDENGVVEIRFSTGTGYYVKSLCNNGIELPIQSRKCKGDGFKYSCGYSADRREFTVKLHEITSDVNLSAKVCGVPYTVQFDSNSPDGTASTVREAEFEYGKGNELYYRSFWFDGYKFLGWATEPDGEVAYKEGQQIMNLSDRYEGVVKLYACWEDAAVRVTINQSPAEGGKVYGGDVYTAGDMAYVSATPSMGYVFDGWYAGEKLLSTQNYYNFAITKDTELEARFRQPKVTVQSLPSAVGNVSISDDVMSGDGTFEMGSKVQINATGSEGYVFLGWYDECGKLVCASSTCEITVDGDKKLTAIFGNGTTQLGSFSGIFESEEHDRPSLLYARDISEKYAGDAIVTQDAEVAEETEEEEMKEENSAEAQDSAVSTETGSEDAVE